MVLLICLRLLLAAQSKPGAFQSNKDADPQAKALLKQVKDNLNIEKGVEINFEFKYTAAESKPTIEKGKVEIKGKKFHLTLGEQEIFSDQKTLWTYLKKRNEVQLQNAEGINYCKYMTHLTSPISSTERLKHQPVLNSNH